MKKALVISGGGALGAWGGGTIEALKTILGKEYDLYVCTSTGSLLAPLSSLNEFIRLHQAYTTVTQKSIFDVNPFNKNGKIKFFNAIWRFIKGKETLGESNNLRKRIEQFFNQEDYIKITEKCEIVVTTVNMLTESAEYKSSKNCNYSDFCDWIWASACAPVFMTLVKKDGGEYVDGGIVEHIPIEYAIENGATEIDVIIHRTQDSSPKQSHAVKNILDHFMKVTNVMHRELSTDDIAISSLQAKDKDVKLNLYYMPYRLTENSLIFNKEEMSKWWEIGKECAVNQISCKQIILKKNKKK